MNRTARVFTAGAATAATAVALTVAPSAMAAAPTDTSELRGAVTPAGVFDHLREFQRIAQRNDGTRVSGTPGYDASADYVAGLLKEAGYEVTRQQFDFPFFTVDSETVFERTAPTQETYAVDEDFIIMDYSGSGNPTEAIEPVDVQIPPPAEPGSTSGCEAADFAGFTPGNVALIQRGSCSFAQKAVNAENAGASAALIFNEGQEGRTDVFAGTLGGPVVSIPVLGTSFAVGEELYNLYQAGAVPKVHVFTDTTSETRSTENVIADTTAGREDRTVVVGAHLDSVSEGPGINDNGTGTGTILEIALQMAELGIEPTNRVRFAFWGAEESGLLGSEHYVATLPKDELRNIALNLNFDMVGSPNYVRFVYDGDGSDTAVSGPSGSGNIEQIFTEYFASQGLASAPTEFSGRSDYGPFIAVGIPAGGLFTGAEGVKTAAEAEVYGGVAGAAYDPCYHQACDSLHPKYTQDQRALFAQLDDAYGGALEGNVNLTAVDEMSDAAAHATLTFAMTDASVSGTARSDGGTGSEMEFQGNHLQR